MEEGQIQVLVFRLDQMETSLDEVSTKLDLLLDNQQRHWTAVALSKQAHNALEQRVIKLEKKADILQEASSDLKVGMAGKLGPGALAGAATSAAMLALKFLSGA